MAMAPSMTGWEVPLGGFMATAITTTEPTITTTVVAAQFERSGNLVKLEADVIPQAIKRQPSGIDLRGQAANAKVTDGVDLRRS
jgi:hypothetical protein